MTKKVASTLSETGLLAWNFYHSVLNEENSRPCILTMATCFSHHPYGKGVEQALETPNVFCTQHGQ